MWVLVIVWLQLGGLIAEERPVGREHYTFAACQAEADRRNRQIPRKVGGVYKFAQCIFEEGEPT